MNTLSLLWLPPIWIFFIGKSFVSWNEIFHDDIITASPDLTGHVYRVVPCHLRCHVCREAPCLRWHRVCREEPCHQPCHVCRGGPCHPRCHVCSFHHLHMRQVFQVIPEQNQTWSMFTFSVKKCHNLMKIASYQEWCPNHFCCFSLRLWETTDVSLSLRFALYHGSWDQWAVRSGELWLWAAWGGGGGPRRGVLSGPGILGPGSLNCDATWHGHFSDQTQHLMIYLWFLALALKFKNMK